MNKKYLHQFLIDTIDEYTQVQMYYANLGGCVLPEYTNTVESIHNYKHVREEFLKISDIIKNMRLYLETNMIDIGIAEELDTRYLGV